MEAPGTTMTQIALYVGLTTVVVVAVGLICWGAVGLFFDRGAASAKAEAERDPVAELQAKNLAAKREFNER